MTTKVIPPNYIRYDNYVDENTIDGFVNSDVKTAAVGDGIAAPGTTNTGKEELAADLAILSGAYKKGDEVPIGLAKTLKIIQHRNKILWAILELICRYLKQLIYILNKRC